MKLPNGEQAEISMQKLIGYCLNSEHPSGKHKARVFASILGITLEKPMFCKNLFKLAIPHNANAAVGMLVRLLTMPMRRLPCYMRPFTMPMRRLQWLMRSLTMPMRSSALKTLRFYAKLYLLPLKRGELESHLFKGVGGSLLRKS
ncbi:MAG: DUF6883 domain-containing protein [Nostoc sp.]|uniref:DUF6883 domain-containing protein n=1 Tax=Nostoc sp. TaxID=1180 RepID=UPI002FFC2FBF